MAHASSHSESAAEQGLLGIVEVFIDTFVICTLTALTIICSGVPIPYGTESGAILTGNAFSAVFGEAGRKLVSLFLICFSFSTILGWSLYGARCTEYLLGKKRVKAFYLLQSAAVIPGAILKTSEVWRIAEIGNGLMVFPNLFALLLLSPLLIQLTKVYSISANRATGG